MGKAKKIHQIRTTLASKTLDDNIKSIQAVLPERQSACKETIETLHKIDTTNRENCQALLSMLTSRLRLVNLKNDNDTNTREVIAKNEQFKKDLLREIIEVDKQISDTRKILRTAEKDENLQAILKKYELELVYYLQNFD